MMNCEQVTKSRRRLRRAAALEQFHPTLLGLRALPLPVAAKPSEDLIQQLRRHLKGRE